MKSNKNIFVWLGLMLCIVFWGSSFVITKELLTSGVDPSIISFGRYLTLTPFILIVYFTSRSKQKIEKSDMTLFTVTTLLGTTFFYLLENNGMKYLNSTMGALIIGTSPIIVAIYETIWLKRKLNYSQIIGILMSVIGLAIFSSNNIEFNKNSIIGILLMLTATISWVCYVVLSKNFTNKYNGISILTYQASIALISLMPTTIIATVDFELMFSLKILLLISIQGILVSGLGYFLYLQSIKYLGPIKSTMAQNLTPFVTLVVSVILLDEKMEVTNIVGVIGVILGLFILSRKGDESLKN